MTAAADELQRTRRAWALPGSGRDRLVALGKRGFPVAAAVILAIGLIWPMTQDREFSFVLSKDRVDMAGDRMRLGGALYRGEDSFGRPFAIRAQSGVQQSSADPRVVLEDLSARMDMEDGLATVTAPRGIYDMDAERLVVAGPVRVRRADGYRLVTSDVAVDIPSRQIIGDGRILGANPLGTFAADTLEADMNDRTLVLTGNVKMRIDP